MAKSTGNNILPREILTGENTILSKAFCIGSDFSCYKHTTEAFLIFLMIIVAAEKGYKRLMEAMHSLKISQLAKSTIDIPA
jgi:cysteinyl-tRNA synthetase